jgi:hypothetical protein
MNDVEEAELPRQGVALIHALPNVHLSGSVHLAPVPPGSIDSAAPAASPLGLGLCRSATRHGEQALGTRKNGIRKCDAAL